MRRAAAAVLQQPLRFALNGWIDAARELAARRALVASFTPELRAARRALNRWVEVMSQLVAERGALRGVIHELQGTGVRRAWRGGAAWRPQEHRAASVVRRGAMAASTLSRMALNGWIEGADERRVALDAHGPRGRGALQRGLRTAMNAWQAARREARASSYRMARAAARCRPRDARSGVPSTGAARARAGGAAARCDGHQEP